MADKELWQIELDLKIDKVNAAQKKYDESLEKIKQSEKRLTAAIMAEEKRSTASKLTELRIREATVKTSLAKEIAENKTKNAKELADYKQMLSEKNAARKKAEAQQKSDSKFTGQTSELGSLNHIQGLRRTLKNTALGTEQYTALNNRLKELTANYNLATGRNALFNRGLLETGENLVTISAGLYLAATGMIRFAGSTVTAFAEQERSQLQLKAVTGDNIAQFERFTKLSADVQNKWGIPDEVTQSLIAYSVAQERSEGQITKNIEAARILAIVQGTDIQDAYKQVEATLEGNTRSLGRQEKDFKGLTEEQLKNGAAVDLIIQKWGKLGNIQDSTSVKVAKLSAAWSETKETIGGVIVDALNPLGDSLANIGLKGQDVVKWIATSVTGFGTLSAGLKLTDKLSKDLISTFGNMAGQLPVIGGFYSSITNYAMQYRDMLYSILGLQSGISNGATYDNARGGTRGGVNLKDPTANSGSIFKGGNLGTGSNNTPEKTLTFLEQFRENIKKLEGDIEALNAQMNEQNIADYERLAIQDQLIAKQKELNELKRINMGLEGIIPTGAILGTPNLRIGREGIGGDSGTARSSSEIADMLADAERQRYEAVVGYLGQMEGSFLNMAQTTGLIDSGFINILNMIKSVLSDGMGIFDAIVGLGGLLAAPFTGGASIPIAAGVGGAIGGGMQGLPNYTMPNQSPLVAPVIIKNPITLGKGLEVENRYNDVRGSIDL